MKYNVKIIVICFAILLIFFTAYSAYSVYEFQKYYGQAEPLFELVRPLAIKSSEFANEYRRRPNDLKEIDLYSKSHDFSELEKYNPTFYTEGDIYFRMRVNRRFSFIIDQNYKPEWETRK